MAPLLARRRYDSAVQAEISPAEKLALTLRYRQFTGHIVMSKYSKHLDNTSPIAGVTIL